MRASAVRNSRTGSARMTGGESATGGGSSVAPGQAGVARTPFRWRAVAVGTVVAMALVGGCVLAVARHEPGPLQRSAGWGAGAPDPAASARLAGRLISKVSALHSAASRPGRWEGVFTEDEVNAWLATDLPRNHPRLLPAGWSEPRVSLEPRHVWVGTRWHAGPLSALVWVRADVRLRSPGEIAVAVDAAGLGGLPLPGDALLKQLAERFSASGVSASVVRLDGRNQLVVQTPDGRPGAAGESGMKGARPAIRLDAVRLDDGELLVAGETVAADGATR